MCFNVYAVHVLYKPGREMISVLDDCWGDVFSILLTIDVASFFSTAMRGASAGCDMICPRVSRDGDGGVVCTQPDAVCSLILRSSILLLQVEQRRTRTEMIFTKTSGAGMKDDGE